MHVWQCLVMDPQPSTNISVSLKPWWEKEVTQQNVWLRQSTYLPHPATPIQAWVNSFRCCSGCYSKSYDKHAGSMEMRVTFDLF